MFTGCEYGDVTPEECTQYVTDGTIKARCASGDANCCDTCAQLQGTGDACNNFLFDTVTSQDIPFFVINVEPFSINIF